MKFMKGVMVGTLISAGAVNDIYGCKQYEQKENCKKRKTNGKEIRYFILRLFKNSSTSVKYHYFVIVQKE